MFGSPMPAPARARGAAASRRSDAGMQAPMGSAAPPPSTAGRCRGWRGRRRARRWAGLSRWAPPPAPAPRPACARARAPMGWRAARVSADLFGGAGVVPGGPGMGRPPPQPGGMPGMGGPQGGCRWAGRRRRMGSAGGMFVMAPTASAPPPAGSATPSARSIRSAARARARASLRRQHAAAGDAQQGYGQMPQQGMMRPGMPQQGDAAAGMMRPSMRSNAGYAAGRAAGLRPDAAAAADGDAPGMPQQGMMQQATGDAAAADAGMRPRATASDAAGRCSQGCSRAGQMRAGYGQQMPPQRAGQMPHRPALREERSAGTRNCLRMCVCVWGGGGGGGWGGAGGRAGRVFSVS